MAKVRRTRTCRETTMKDQSAAAPKKPPKQGRQPAGRGKRGCGRAPGPDASAGGALFGATVCAAVIAALLWEAHGPAAPRRTRLLAPPPPAWTEVIHPERRFSLAADGYGLPGGYRLWRAARGDRRRDEMTFGSFAGKESFLQLTIEQGARAPQPFYSDLARQAALEGLFIERSDVPRGQTSAFGTLSLSDATLASGARARSCLIFRNDDPAVELSGISCSGAAGSAAAADLVCLLDRLSLTDQTASADTKRLFRGAAASTQGCDGPAEAVAQPRLQRVEATPSFTLQPPRDKAPRRRRRASLEELVN
jgi:hypothetical protein